MSDETSARTTVLDLAPDYDGPARIDGYTVVHSRAGEPERAIVVATTPDGRRTVAATTDTDLAAAMVGEEWCGRDVARQRERVPLANLRQLRGLYAVC